MRMDEPQPEHSIPSGVPDSDPASANWLGGAGSETGAPACRRFKATVKNPGWDGTPAQGGMFRPARFHCRQYRLIAHDPVGFEHRCRATPGQWKMAKSSSGRSYLCNLGGPSAVYT